MKDGYIKVPTRPRLAARTRRWELGKHLEGRDLHTTQSRRSSSQKKKGLFAPWAVEGRERGRIHVHEQGREGRSWRSAYFSSFVLHGGRVQFLRNGSVVYVGRFRPHTADRAPMLRHFANACNLSPTGSPRGHNDALAVGGLRFVVEWEWVSNGSCNCRARRRGRGLWARMGHEDRIGRTLSVVGCSVV